VFPADSENAVLRFMVAGSSREEAARQAGISPRELDAVLADGQRRPGSAAWQFLARVEAVERGKPVELPKPGLREWLGSDQGRP
jgi:hypothetical protein